MKTVKYIVTIDVDDSVFDDEQFGWFQQEMESAIESDIYYYLQDEIIGYENKDNYKVNVKTIEEA